MTPPAVLLLLLLLLLLCKLVSTLLIRIVDVISASLLPLPPSKGMRTVSPNEVVVVTIDAVITPARPTANA
jgi:hypothetical protein